VTVALRRVGRLVPVVEDLSLSLAAGETLAIVGESGSGKTTAALAILGLLPEGAVVSGQILLQGRDLCRLAPRARRKLCGAKVGMVFQDPLAALNPTQRVGTQIGESIRLHRGLSRSAARARAVELLHEVGIEGAAVRAADYPHMFSGGMRQRVMIAAALACDPVLLIADEPTSGLDAALKEQIFVLLAGLRKDRRLAVLLISHDMSLVARHADRVAVFYAGRCVETGPAQALLRSPRHRYTYALLRAAPRVGGGVPAAIPGAMPEPEAFAMSCRFALRCDHAQAECVAHAPTLTASPDDGGHLAACYYPVTTPAGETDLPSAAVRLPLLAGEVLRVDGLTVRYRTGGSARAAVQDVSFRMAPGECLGIVGASGSGKTSLAHAILHMVPYEGCVVFGGETLTSLRGAPLRAARRRMQLVFQNPAASLDPVQTAGEAIEEALQLGGMGDRRQRRARAAALLEQVGLAASLLDRLPRMLSGGQAQRVAIARALAAEPALLVLDEPTASLDVSTAAGLLALLLDLAARLGVSYIVITHDLAVASVLAHRVVIMEEGRIGKEVVLF